MSDCIMSKLESNSGMQMPLFLSTFKDKKNFEIAATICAWMSNGWPHEDVKIQEYIKKVMLPTPLEFIERFEYKQTNQSFFRILSSKQMNTLLSRIQFIYKYHGSLEQGFVDTLAFERKTKYNHEILAKMLSGNTGFQTTESNCSFYRYNLLYYWLTYKFNIWENKRYGRALLPCNDATFKNAYSKGFTKVLLKTNLTSTKILTAKAKEIYGKDDFFKMYEDLNILTND